MGAYLLALVLTMAVELPLYTAVLGPGARHFGAPSAPLTTAVRTGVLANLASHPAAFLVVHPLLRHPLGSVASLAVVEVAVLFVEALVVLRRHGDPLLAAVAASVANLVSLSVGALLLS